MNICSCKFNDCINSQQCKRFLEATGEVMNFKVICTNDNSYQWLCKTDNYVEVKNIPENNNLAEENNITQSEDNKNDE